MVEFYRMRLHPLPQAVAIGLLANLSSIHILGLMCCSTALYAAEPNLVSSTAPVSPVVATTLPQQAALDQNTPLIQTTQSDNQNAKGAVSSPEPTYDPQAVYALKESDVPPLDTNMAREIMQIAEQAQQQARQDAATLPTIDQIITQQKNEQLPADPPIPSTTANSAQVAQLITDLQQQRVNLDTDFTTPRTDGYDPSDPARNLNNGDNKGWLSRLLNRNQDAEIAKIRVSVDGGSESLNTNVTNKLSSFTVDAFQDFDTALPQLRLMALQAAQAMGYYNAQFRFTRSAANALQVTITPNDPVKVVDQSIVVSGAGAMSPAFRVIQVVPDLNVGDIFNHGLYETTKSRLVNAASNQGYFDSYWRMHDVRVDLPQNTAHIQLKYETGPRYKLQAVEFRMSDSTKPFPLRRSVLEQLVPFKAGDDYTNWRVNNLASNLIDSRYFNSSVVNVVRPDAIQPPLELPDDIKQALNAQQEQQLIAANQAAVGSNPNVRVVNSQKVVSDQVFAGTDAATKQSVDDAIDGDMINDEQRENERLQRQARQTKTIPVIVTLNADQLNNVEAGIGYGTDTGIRVRSQYRRSIVNDRGHSFDANLELSKVRQAFDGRYMIPYKSILNDYLSLIAGYEHETRDHIGSGIQLGVESAVAGAERVIKKPLGEWQQNYSVRYRLDRINRQGDFNETDLPTAFQVLTDNSSQQSLLAGYQINRTTQNNRIDPTQGLRQFYGIQVGSKALLTETDLAILNAGWRFIYSMGQQAKHQVVGRGDVGYILSNDFDHVPYNLRFFAGGDQSLRGFDYKSLAPTENNLLVGGQALAVGSLEYNYLFRPKWRGAVFVDVGNAYDKSFSNPTQYGVGVGLRWASPIGPIRIDLAAGVSAEKIPVRLHFFIGPPL